MRWFKLAALLSLLACFFGDVTNQGRAKP